MTPPLSIPDVLLLIRQLLKVTVEAAAFALTYGTSHHALLDRGRLHAGETMLVLGAAGGVGTAANGGEAGAGASRESAMAIDRDGDDD